MRQSLAILIALLSLACGGGGGESACDAATAEARAAFDLDGPQWLPKGEVIGDPDPEALGAFTFTIGDLDEALQSGDGVRIAEWVGTVQSGYDDYGYYLSADDREQIESGLDAASVAADVCP